MSSYYYFAATLPGLRYDAALPFGYGEFVARAGRYLSLRDLAALESARLNVPEDGAAPAPAQSVPLLARYYRWERAMRNELARLRSQRLQKPAERHVRPGEPEWDGIRTAQAAFQADDPLQGELLVEKERWAFIESLAVNRFFDLEFLCAYALQLQSLERRGRFRADAGEAGYKTVYQSVLDTADYRDESGVSK